VVDSPGLENRYSSSNYRGFKSLSLLLFIEYIFFLENVNKFQNPFRRPVATTVF
jgi:hypothetical protein